MNKINYQLELDKIINKIEGENRKKSFFCIAAAPPAAAMFWRI